MRNKKGFTLIELLAVIAVLAIILVIATTNVMGKIKDSKTKAKYTAAKEITDMAEAYTAAIGTDSDCVSIGDLIKEGYLEKDATNPRTGENGGFKVGDMVCKSSANPQEGYESKNNKYIFDGYEYVFASPDDLDIDQDAGIKNYALGEEICLNKECFYVLEDDGDIVKALAKYNLLVGKSKITIASISSTTDITTSTSGYGLQNLSAKGFNIPQRIVATIPFSSTNNYLKEYKSRFSSYKNVGMRLITYSELEALGCINNNCSNAPEWVYSTSYWCSNGNGVDMSANGKIVFKESTEEFYFGLRPVITISKSEIK